MTFAIAGLVAEGRHVDRPPGQRRRLLSRFLRRPRRGPSMTRRVVLIGHPVSHSLSGAMQQAAFDALGIDANYELWDRKPDRARRRDHLAPGRRVPGRQRHDPAQGTGRPARRPADRGCPRDGRGQHDHARRQEADRPQHRRAGLQGGTRQARRQAEDAAPGGDPRRRRRRSRRCLRPDHRGLPARHRLQPPSPSSRGPGPAFRQERGAHGAARRCRGTNR